MTRVVSSLEHSVKNLEVPTLRGHLDIDCGLKTKFTRYIS